MKGGPTPAVEREHLAARLQAMTSLLRDIGLLTSGADASLLANLDRRPALEALSRSLGVDRVERAFTAVARAQDALDATSVPRSSQTGWLLMFTKQIADRLKIRSVSDGSAWGWGPTRSK